MGRVRGVLGGLARYLATHEKHKAIDYSDSIARLENSHGRATKNKMITVHYFSGGINIWITVTVLAVSRINLCYSHSTKWTALRTHERP